MFSHGHSNTAGSLALNSYCLGDSLISEFQKAYRKGKLCDLHLYFFILLSLLKHNMLTICAINFGAYNFGISLQ